MNYFRQSLLSLPSYIPSDLYRPDFSLFSIQDILNEPVLHQDRRDINRIYEQTDISTKRNSIINMNNKKQKKLINNPIHGSSLHIPNKSLREDSHPPQFQILGRQNAYFQQIHPTDVDKTHDENIFDYRLHRKLAQGEQIFKVQQVKRKSKKRNTAGKQCQCCGKQVMKNHRCQHTFCDQKCGKVTETIKRSHHRKDPGSSISDSKDENWSDQNIDQQKIAKLSSPNRKESDKKSKLNRRQSSSSNRDQFTEPSQYLLASIQKLLNTQENNFTYKVLQIKEYESEEQDEQNRQNFDDQKDLDLDDSDNKRLYQDQMRDQDNDDKMYQEKQQGRNAYGKGDMFEEKRQEKGITFTISMFNLGEQTHHKRPINTASNFDVNAYREIKQHESNHKQQVRENTIPQAQSKDKVLYIQSKNKQQQAQVPQTQSKEKVAQNLIKKRVPQAQSKEKVPSAQSKKKVPLAQNKKKVPSAESKYGDNRQQTKRKNQAQNKQDNPRLVNHQISTTGQVSKIVDISRLPPSESESQSNKGKGMEQGPEVALIEINNEKKRQNLSNLQSSSEQMIDERQENKQQIQKRVQQNQNRANPSVPDLQQQNSLDDQIDDIIDPQIPQYHSLNPYSHNHNYQAKNSYSDSPQKISKKQSKKIKIIEKTILMSSQIQDIDPISDLQEQEPNQSQQQEEKLSENDQGNKGLGRGKGRGMGRGKGILQEELDIYQENSKLLSNSDNNQPQPEYDSQEDSQSQEENNNSTLNRRAIKFPKSQHMLPQPSMNLCLSPTSHVLTPKRQIPNMERIIKQIQIESQKQTYEKGLGRGKVFGRGLGVLEEAEELQKEVQEDGLDINYEGKLNPRKRVKLIVSEEQQKQQNWQKQQKQQNQQGQQEEQGQQQQQSGEQELVDKFQQLIQEQQVIVPQHMHLIKSSQTDKLQALCYKHYLQKRQSIAVGLGNNYHQSNDSQDEYIGSKESAQQNMKSNKDNMNKSERQPEDDVKNYENNKGQRQGRQERQGRQAGVSQQLSRPEKDNASNSKQLLQQQYEEMISHQEEQIQSVIDLQNNNNSNNQHGLNESQSSPDLDL